MSYGLERLVISLHARKNSNQVWARPTGGTELKMYQEMGIATFELNSFKSRNIVSTVGSQTEVTIAAMVLDAYRALEVLSNGLQFNNK